MRSLIKRKAVFSSFIPLYFRIIIIFTALIISCSNDDNILNDDNNPITPTSSVPVLSTDSISAITSSTAYSGGSITSDGGATVTSRGVCWSTTQTPTISDNKTNDSSGIGSFKSYMKGLTIESTYYVRAYASNSAGTGYGSTLSFTTPETVSDIDGNVYQTVKIGAQLWMMENLKVTHYRNGEVIPNVTDHTEWASLTTGGWCSYNNLVENVATYGLLYNWYAVDDSRNLAPEGWHVPTNDEWRILVDYLGGSNVAGGKLKEVGTVHWNSPNTGATNESGFLAISGGIRSYTWLFTSMRILAWFWSSTEGTSSTAKGRGLHTNLLSISSGIGVSGKTDGFSIRCVKD